MCHAVGNYPLYLNEWGVDFAVWGHYKLLNSCLGSPAGMYINERHLGNREMPRYESWFGASKENRFTMDKNFMPMDTADAW